MVKNIHFYRHKTDIIVDFCACLDPKYLRTLLWSDFISENMHEFCIGREQTTVIANPGTKTYTYMYLYTMH